MTLYLSVVISKLQRRCNLCLRVPDKVSLRKAGLGDSFSSSSSVVDSSSFSSLFNVVVGLVVFSCLNKNSGQDIMNYLHIFFFMYMDMVLGGGSNNQDYSCLLFGRLGCSFSFSTFGFLPRFAPGFALLSDNRSPNDLHNAILFVVLINILIVIIPSRHSQYPHVWSMVILLMNHNQLSCHLGTTWSIYAS